MKRFFRSPLLSRKRGLSSVNRILCSHRFLSCSAISSSRARTIEELRRLSETTFMKDEFRNVKWVGVFGSFARATHTDESDVDIVIHRRKIKDLPQPLYFLEELLPKIWNRSVDIIYIRNSSQDFQYGGYVALEALLCSQTIFGSSQDEEVIELRRKALKIIDTSEGQFNDILKQIKDIRLSMEGVSEEQFLASATLQQSTLSQIMSVLNFFGSFPRGHPMRSAFYFTIFEVVGDTRKILDSLQDINYSMDNQSPCYWKAIWKIASQCAPGTIGKIARYIERFAFPFFQQTRDRNTLVQQLNPDEFIGCSLNILP